MINGENFHALQLFCYLYEKQVDCIYVDPPYGVKFGGNFQPFIRKRDVRHNNDADLTREPEMVKAYRDTWELGLHSYLTYLRDRFLLCLELLAPTGSIFVQISDENLHHVREVLDEVSEFYGRELKAVIKSVTAMIEPIMIVLMGSIVGFIAMSIILPIFKLSQLVK